MQISQLLDLYQHLHQLLLQLQLQLLFNPLWLAREMFLVAAGLFLQSIRLTWRALMMKSWCLRLASPHLRRLRKLSSRSCRVRPPNLCPVAHHEDLCAVALLNRIALRVA